MSRRSRAGSNGLIQALSRWGGLLVILTWATTGATASALCVLDENFDLYPPATDLHLMGGWKGFNSDPFLTAFTTTFPEPANSLPQSVNIHSDSNLVHEHCTTGEGVYVLSAFQYIESPYLPGISFEPDPGSIFRLYNTYSDSGTQLVSIDIRIDPGGDAKVLHGDGSFTIDVPYDTDRWIKIQSVIDLDNDWTRVYYDDQLVTEYTWTGGVIGAGGGALDIAAVDLYANGSSSVYYDDILIEPQCDLDDDFDLYLNGSDLHGQGGWKGFDNNPAFGAPATQDQSNSSPQSVDISGTANLVQETCTPLDGVYSLTVWQYIPSAYSSSTSIDPDPGSTFRVYSVYSDLGTKVESVSIRADSDTSEIKVLHGAGSDTIDIPYETDRWVKIQTVIDLDDDWTRIYYDDALVTEYTWTGGVLGGGGGALDIAAVDLYANGSTSVYYDDLNLERGCGVTRNSDVDEDTLSALAEFLLGTSSCDPDSDDDTLLDAEDSCPLDPNNQCEGVSVPTSPSGGITLLALLLLGAGAVLLGRSPGWQGQ